MFGKGILRLRGKDKLFFLLVAILAIVGMYFVVTSAATYVSNHLQGHQKEIKDTKDHVTKLQEEYGKPLLEMIEEVKQTKRMLEKTIQEEFQKSRKECFEFLDQKFSLWGFVKCVIVVVCAILVTYGGIVRIDSLKVKTFTYWGFVKYLGAVVCAILVTYGGIVKINGSQKK